MTTTAVAKQEPSRGLATFKQLLEHKKLDLQQVAANRLDMSRLIPVVIARISRKPDLLECTPDSFYTAFHLAAQLGLEPEGPFGHFYLIPRRNKHRANLKECNPLIGYKGYCELARRSGLVDKLYADVVYEGEEFRYDRGTGDLHHPYALDVERTDDRKIVAAYAYAKIKGCPDPVVVVLNRAQIEQRRARSLAADDGPWKTDYAAMARKSALRALLTSGLVPLSPEMATAIEHEHLVETEARVVESVPLAAPEPEASAPRTTGTTRLKDRMRGRAAAPQKAAEPVAVAEPDPRGDISLRIEQAAMAGNIPYEEVLAIASELARKQVTSSRDLEQLPVDTLKAVLNELHKDAEEPEP